MAKIVYKNFKIGLSDTDKAKMREDIKKQLNYGSPSGVYTTSEILGFETNKGIVVSSDDNYWYYWNNNIPDTEKLNKYEKGELFTQTQELSLIESRLDGVEAVNLVQDTNIALKQNKTDNTLETTSKNIVGAINELNARPQSQPLDVFDLLGMIENPYPNEMVIDVNETNDAIEQHLDRNYEASLDKEVSLAVARQSSNKQQWTLGGEEVARLKGLRVWIKFAYNGSELCLSQDIRFPTDRASYQYFVSTPIPNPAIFSEKILVQYDTDNDLLSLNTTGGSISADTQIIEVKGIK